MEQAKTVRLCFSVESVRRFLLCFDGLPVDHNLNVMLVTIDVVRRPHYAYYLLQFISYPHAINKWLSFQRLESFKCPFKIWLFTWDEFIYSFIMHRSESRLVDDETNGRVVFWSSCTGGKGIKVNAILDRSLHC